MKSIGIHWLGVLLGVSVLTQLTVGWLTNYYSALSMVLCITNLTLFVAAYIVAIRSRPKNVVWFGQAFFVYGATFEGLCLLTICARLMAD